MPHKHVYPPFTYEVPLELYIESYNARFPKHELFPYILDTEVLEEKDDADIYFLKRRVKLDIDAPKFFKKLTGIKFAYFVEEQTHYKKERKIVIKCINETMIEKASLEEETIYEPHPDNPEWTILNQVGTCTLHVSTLGFTSLLESYMMGLYVSRYNDCRKLDLVMIEHTKKKKEQENQGKQEQQ